MTKNPSCEYVMSFKKGEEVTEKNALVITFNVMSTYYAKMSDELNETRFYNFTKLLDSWIEKKAIICLQEVSLEWSPKLVLYFRNKDYFYYDSIYIQELGVGIAVPTDKFEVVEAIPFRVSEIIKKYSSIYDKTATDFEKVFKINYTNLIDNDEMEQFNAMWCNTIAKYIKKDWWGVIRVDYNRDTTDNTSRIFNNISVLFGILREIYKISIYHDRVVVKESIITEIDKLLTRYSNILRGKFSEYSEYLAGMINGDENNRKILEEDADKFLEISMYLEEIFEKLNAVKKNENIIKNHASESMYDRLNRSVCLKLKFNDMLFYVATYHAPARSEKPTLMHQHMFFLIKHLFNLAKSDPLILAGDFNSLPDHKKKYEGVNMWDGYGDIYDDWGYGSKTEHWNGYSKTTTFGNSNYSASSNHNASASGSSSYNASASGSSSYNASASGSNSSVGNSSNWPVLYTGNTAAGGPAKGIASNTTAYPYPAMTSATTTDYSAAHTTTTSYSVASTHPSGSQTTSSYSSEYRMGGGDVQPKKWNSDSQNWWWGGGVSNPTSEFKVSATEEVKSFSDEDFEVVEVEELGVSAEKTDDAQEIELDDINVGEIANEHEDVKETIDDPEGDAAVTLEEALYDSNEADVEYDSGDEDEEDEENDHDSNASSEWEYPTTNNTTVHVSVPQYVPPKTYYPVNIGDFWDFVEAEKDTDASGWTLSDEEEDEKNMQYERDAARKQALFAQIKSKPKSAMKPSVHTSYPSGCGGYTSSYSNGHQYNSSTITYATEVEVTKELPGIKVDITSDRSSMLGKIDNGSIYIMMLTGICPTIIKAIAHKQIKDNRELQSVYRILSDGYEPHYTGRFDGLKCTCDYIFKSDGTDVILTPIDVMEIRYNSALPNCVIPSDHLPIGAIFKFTSQSASESVSVPVESIACVIPENGNSLAEQVNDPSVPSLLVSNCETVPSLLSSDCETVPSLLSSDCETVPSLLSSDCEMVSSAPVNMMPMQSYNHVVHQTTRIQKRLDTPPPPYSVFSSLTNAITEPIKIISSFFG